MIEGFDLKTFDFAVNRIKAEIEEAGGIVSFSRLGEGRLLRLAFPAIGLEYKARIDPAGLIILGKFRPYGLQICSSPLLPTNVRLPFELWKAMKTELAELMRIGVVQISPKGFELTTCGWDTPLSDEYKISDLDEFYK